MKFVTWPVAEATRIVGTVRYEFEVWFWAGGSGWVLHDSCNTRDAAEAALNAFAEHVDTIYRIDKVRIQTTRTVVERSETSRGD